MPTFGKVIGAVLFGALAWYVSTLIAPLFPEGTNLGFFQEVNTAIGLFAGWSIAGARVGQGYSAAISYGITTLVAMVVMALFLNSSVVMIEHALRKRYKGPSEAVADVFALFVEHGAMMATAEIIGTLVVGSILAGLVTEFFGRRFS